MPPTLFETSVPIWRVFALLGSTLGIAVGSALLAMAIGVSMGLLLYLSGRKATSLWIGALVLPLIWPPFQTAIGWMVLQGESGITLFQKDSFDSWILSILFSPLGVILVHSVSFWPIPALLSWWGFLKLDREMVDQLRVEGVSIIQSSLFLCRLNLVPISVSMLLVVIFSLGDIGAAELLQVNTFPVLLYTELNLIRTLGPVIRMSAPLLVFMAVGIAIWTSLRDRIRIETETFEPLAAQDRWISPAYSRWLLSLLVLVGPGTVLATESVQIVRDLSTIHLPLLTECLSASIWTGIGAVLLGALFLQCGLLASGNRSVAWTIDCVSFLLFAIPAPVLALALLKMFSSMGRTALPLLDSFWILSLACAIRFYWVAWSLVQSGRDRIPQSLEDRMKTEGLSAWQRTRHIFNPLLRPQIMAGLTLVWALSLGEVTLTRILQPPGVQTLAARTVNFMHWGHDGMVAAGLVTVALLEFLPLLVYIGWKSVWGRTQ
ncbi:MAG: iron ABC transporter permease [Candidatus Omnitrophica bacterium]|nr:iron ABC transporter permease [Candidatus Omnitrophota bacterium]